MKVDVSQKSQIEKVLKVEVEPEKYKPILDKLIKDVAKDFPFPGFRKGKVPAAFIVKRMGYNVFKHDLLEELLPIVTQEAVESQNIMPLSIPQITPLDQIEFENEKPISFEFTVEVIPEFELKTYKDLTLKRKPQKVDVEELLQSRIDDLREQSGEMEPMEEDRPLEKGDVARVDFDSFVDGEAVDSGLARDYYMTVDEKNFIPGFMEQLIGKKAGDEWEFDIEFPDSYPNTKLAGEEVHFKMKLHGIMLKKLPELDDEFAKTAGRFDTFEQMKEDMRKKIVDEIEGKEKDSFRTQILDQIAEEMEDVLIPPTLVKHSMEGFMRNFEQQLQMMGKNLESYLKEQGTNPNDFARRFYPQAREMARADLIVDQVAKQENIESTDEEVDKEVQQIAERLNQEPASIRATMEKSGYLDNMKYSLRIRKVYDFIIDHSNIVEEEEVQEEEKPETPADIVEEEKAVEPEENLASVTEE